MGAQQIGVFTTTTIVASPAAAAETVVGQINNVSVDVPTRKLLLMAWILFTVGTNGTSANIRIRQTSLTGALVAQTGAYAAGFVAATPFPMFIGTTDIPGDVAGFTYVVTLQVTAGSAPSTLSNLLATATLVN